MCVQIQLLSWWRDLNSWPLPYQGSALPLSYISIHEKSGRRGSNSRHSAWKADALPTELLPQKKSNKINSWGEQDSNLWRWKPADLQSALVGRLSISPQVKNQQITINIEPVEGFEPTTPRLQITCSGQLSYAGVACIIISGCKSITIFLTDKFFMTFFSSFFAILSQIIDYQYLIIIRFFA